MSTTSTPLGAGGNLRRQATADEALVQDADHVLARAIRERWPISNDLRERAVATAMVLLDSLDYRARTAALRFLVNADNVNAKRERTDSQASTADRVSARDVAARLLSTPEGRALAAAQAELLGAPPALQTGLEAPPAIQTDSLNSDSGGVLEREPAFLASSQSPYTMGEQLFTSLPNRQPLLVSGLDAEAILTGVLGAVPDTLADSAAEATAYTSNPPEPNPPPAPPRRPSLAERRAGKRRNR